MGRKPHTTAMLKATGQFRNDRHGSRVDVDCDLQPPQKPSWVKGDSAKLWNEILETLPPGVLAKSDTATVIGCCEWWAIWRQFNDAVRKGEGDPYRMVMLATMAWKNFSKESARLGLSPTDRARLRVEPTDNTKADPLAAFWTEDEWKSTSKKSCG